VRQREREKDTEKEREREREKQRERNRENMKFCGGSEGIRSLHTQSRNLLAVLLEHLL
jgi:hypothetical protein